MSAASVNVAFAAAQGAGDLSVVMVGWNDTTAQVASVTDSKGNAYHLAIGPGAVAGVLSQSIYYASNIAAAAAGANTVTVTFTQAAQFADIRILEYRGVDPAAPLDVAIGATGNSGTSSTAAVTTTNASDVLVAGNMVATNTRGSGTNFTRRLITSPDGDIAEDRIVTAVGAYSASAPLNGSGPWVMQMVAFKAAGSTPPPPDTQPPSAPSGLAATASSTGIDLSWTAATDNVGVTAYLIERCAGAGCAGFTQVGTTPGPAFSDGGLTAGTSYSYRVRATDAAGNLGVYSNVASATTPAAATIPTFVQGNFATPQSASSAVTAAYTAAQRAGDLNVVAVGWNDATSHVVSVSDGAGNAYAPAVGPTVLAAGLSQSIWYASGIAASAGGNTVTVRFDAAAQFVDLRILEYSNVAAASPVDATAAGTGSSATSATPSATTTSAQDLLVAANMVQTLTSGPGPAWINRMITSPDGDIAEDWVVASPGTYTASAQLASSGGWVMQMVAFKAAGALPPPPDTQPPTAPTGLAASAFSSTRVDLSWAASTDNVGVIGYIIEGCTGAGCTVFAQIGTSAATSFSNTGLTAGTSYSYRVRATDAAGNLSAASGAATATTPSPDTQPPTAPAGLSASASGTQVSLSWTASTDNVGVTGYQIERCSGAGCATFAQVGTSASASFIDGSVSAGATFGYRVRASDAAGNLSAYSNVASVTTTASTTPPAFVQGNAAAPQSPSSTVTVAWPAAQKAGDLDVVVVGWNDATSHVTSVSDAGGNAYALVAGPVVLAVGLSQSVYAAPGIAAAAAGALVTVRFDAPATFADVRILEYSGIVASNPVDGTAAGSGSSATSITPAVTTTNTLDLLVAANMVFTATGSAGSGFTSRIITSPDGDIAEDRVVTAAGSYASSAALNASGPWVMQLVAFKGSGVPAAPDTTPPAVTVTAPFAGATVAGATTVTVTATDTESGILAVQLLVDGNPAGVPDIASPFSFTLDTAKYPNGAHTVGATAWDGARNAATAAAVSVTFNNATPGNPAATGLWSGTVQTPIVSVHQALAPGGHIVMWDGQSFGGDARVWDYLTSSFAGAAAPVNLFCSAHEQMGDGRIFVAGGHGGGAHVGITAGNIFDPVTRVWTVLPDMSFPRWYPTATALPDGRMLVVGGESSCNQCNVQTPEVYNPLTNAWTQLTSAQMSFPYYPHVFVLPDGRVFVPSAGREPMVSQMLDATLHSWTAVGGPAVDGGSSLMYQPWKFLKSGTSVDPDLTRRTSVATAYVLDLTQPSPTWRQVPGMTFARAYHTLTSLPDGNVLVTGGGPSTAATDTGNAILTAELWSPSTETFTRLGNMTSPRLYHSSALLLPDGRVAILGGGRFDDLTAPTDQFNAEFYSPPYLFKGPRPAIASAPATLAYGQPFTVQTPDAARIASVAMIRFGSVTHDINMGQRFLPLAFTAGSGGLFVTAPVDRNLAPPGNYMLFIVDTNGVPSVAATVHF
ncbi:MAG TPA: galactose oxidase-like domain-containing protein [Myxococcales bacterium]|nr:galactose oxidase-like domain-containing protein [Myxococcales bacterium]